MPSRTRSNLFDQDSIFSSLRLQSKFYIKEQQELLDKNDLAFLRRIDIKKHRNNNNIYTVTGFIIINNKELSFSHNLKNPKHIQYWINWKNTLHSRFEKHLTTALKVKLDEIIV